MKKNVNKIINMIINGFFNYLSRLFKYTVIYALIYISEKLFKMNISIYGYLRINWLIYFLNKQPIIVLYFTVECFLFDVKFDDTL